jgi:uncharacterized protein (TIGR02145 family)
MRQYCRRRAAIVQTAFVLVAAFMFNACQNSSTSSDNRPVTVEPSFLYNDAWKTPDSLTWAIGDFSHQEVESQSITSTQFSARFTIDKPTKDTVHMGVWVAGMRIARISFLEEGSSNKLNLLSPKYDSVARAILLLCPAKADRNRDTLLARYARGLVDATTGFEGFPKSCPIGIDTAAVLRQSLAYAVRKGVALQTMVKTWQLPLDTIGARALAPELLSKGLVTAAQLSKALPPYPIRMTKSVALASAPVPGGEVVGLSGVFAWEAGRVIKPGFQVRTANGVDRSNFHFVDSRTGRPVDTARLVFPGDTTFDLSGALALQLDSSAPAGLDTLVVTLADGNGHSAQGRVVFRVTKPTAPKIVISSSKDTSVSNSTRKIWVSASVTDSFGPHTFKIQSKTISGPPYGDSVILEVGRNSIALEVCNQAKLCSRDSLDVVRATATGDTIAPVVVRVSPRSDTALDNETRSFPVSWTVTDDSLLGSVSLNGAVLNGLGALYSTTVNLKTGIDTLVLLAVDARGNARRDTVRIERKPDTTKPVITRSAGTNDTVIRRSGTSNIPVSWKVADFALRIVTIEGTPVTGTDGTYSSTVPFSVDSAWIRIMAVDTAGNTSRDSILVRRVLPPIVDTTPPVIGKVFAPRDTAVGYDTRSIALSWTIYDDSLLASVSLNGETLPGTSALYQVSVRLKAGIDTFVLKAQDQHGNVRTDTVVVTRKPDTAKPVLARGKDTRDTVLTADSSSHEVSWKVTDQALKNVVIAGVEVAGNAGEYSANARLTSDSVWIKIVATDSMGNTATDSVLVCKLLPPTVNPAGQAMKTGSSVTVVIVPAKSGDSIEVSTNGNTWSKYATGLYIDSTKIVYSRARRYGTISRVSMAAFVYPIRLDLPSAVAADSIVAMVDSIGLDSVQLSTDTASGWSRGPRLIVRNSGTVYARGWLGGVASMPSKAECTISHDTSIASITVSDWQGSVNAAILGGALSLDSLHPLVGKVAIVVRTTNPLARTSINGILTDSVFISKDTTLDLAVTNGPSTGRFPMRVSVSKRLRDSLFDTRDSHVYKATKIGTQWWMAQNLNYRKSILGSDTIGYCYDFNVSKCDTAGRLYNWEQANNGVCSSGWHLPSFDEWTQLKRAMPDTIGAGKYLKDTNMTGSEGDPYGFKAITSGWLTPDLGNSQWGSVGYWWSATPSVDEGNAWGAAVIAARNDLYQYPWVKTDHFSVRCVRN